MMSHGFNHAYWALEVQFKDVMIAGLAKADFATSWMT